MRRLPAVLLALLLPLCAHAHKPGEELPLPSELPQEFTDKKPKPWIVRMMIHETPKGMFIGLPIVDTNPNKGTTYGFMPILVGQNATTKRITHIFAPSLTYNRTFKMEQTMRAYFYPTDKATYFARGAWSGNANKDLIGEMEDFDFMGKDISVGARLAFDIDGTKRFHGVGPDSGEFDETNYLRKTFGYTARVGLPIFKDSGVKFNVAHRLAGEKITDGVIPNLTNIRTRFPQNAPHRFHQDAEIQFFLDYDTRDSAMTTSRGFYAKGYMGNSQRAFASEYTFQRYGADLRFFQPWAEKKNWTTALRFRYDQLLGSAPFYLLPSMGGKDTHRAYAEGRFTDQGMMVASIEHRIIVAKAEMAGVTTEMEIAPFFGLGSVFKAPKHLSNRYVRPEYGVAFRAITRPQVVGSIDLGYGQEGGSVFMDINYSF